MDSRARHMAAEASPAPSPGAGPRPLPLGIAALVAILLSLVAELRMQCLIVDGQPGDPMVWSAPRIGFVALLLFAAIAPISVWIARGGIDRTLARLGASGGRLWKRFETALGISAIAGFAGWLLGWGAAWVQQNLGDWRYSVTLMAFAIAFTLLVYFRAEVLADAAWGFLILGLSFGIAFVALAPVQPNSVWDGQGHFNAANAMSYVEDAEYDEGDLIALADIPYVMAGHLERRVWSDMSLEVLNQTTAEIDRLQGEGATEVMEGSARHGGSSWVSFNAVGRLPLAVGLWLGRLLGFGNVGEYTVARLANLALYVVLWFLGIRYLKGSKLVLSAVALAPTGFYVASGFSYDAWLCACLGFSFCRYLGELQRPEEPLRGSGAAAILVAFALGCLVKAVYFPLALVFLAMPRGKFQSKDAIGRGWWSFSVVLAAMLLLSTFALPFLMRGGAGYSDARMNEGASSTGQLAYIFEAPGAYLDALWASGLEFFGPGYLRDATALLEFIHISSFETALGWTYLLFLLFVALFVRDASFKGQSLWLGRIFAGVGMVATYALFATALYIGFTTVGGSEVDGLQPRYLLPFFPLLFGLILYIQPLTRLLARWRRGAAVGFWAFLFVYFAAFITLKFVVFFE